MRLGGPWLVIGAAAAAIAALAMGQQLAGWWQFVWPGIVIAWALLILLGEHELRRRQDVVDYQRKTIEIQLNVIAELQQMMSRAWGDGPA